MEATQDRTLLHGKFDADGVQLHYVTAGDGEPLVLLHGFPQTWYQWRHLIPDLAEHFTVIAPDYRGAGDSSRPLDGYDKRTMAADIRALVRHLVGARRVALVGHDVGAFVAYSYAAHFAAEVSNLVVVEGVVPGTPMWDDLLASGAAWHVDFHAAGDVAEMLVAGRERAYLRQFFDNRAYLNVRLTADAFEHYVDAYSRVGAMRAAFQTYRALRADALAHRELIAEHKLDMPVLIVGSEENGRGPALIQMGELLAHDSRGVLLPRCGHWIPEEQPELLLRAITDFL